MNSVIRDKDLEQGNPVGFDSRRVSIVDVVTSSETVE